MPSLSQIIHDINQSNYRLDTLGVAGLLGGENAVDALETIHLYKGRRWAGWYNYPGAVDVAKTFGQMANSRLWDSVFPGPNESPAVTFRLAGKPGPEYSGSYSGTKLSTGYLGYLIAQKSLCPDFPCRPLSLSNKDGSRARETRIPAAVMVISLPEQQDRRSATGTASTELISISPKSILHPPLALCSVVPSAVSVLACVFCLIGHDSLCASLILLGILCSGFSSLTIGTAKLKIRVPIPSSVSPPGDGLMLPEGGSVIILKGKEADVNVITKGEFELDYSAGILPHPKHHTIGFSSVLLFLQFLVQLLLTPRCTLFGQILFLVSWVASGGYHLYVASYERESVHWELLSGVLSATMEKWTLGTRTQMAVFVCLVLGDSRPYPHKSDPAAVLKSIIPNDTAVWQCWRRAVVKELGRFWKESPLHSYDPSIEVESDGEEKREEDEYSQLTTEEKNLLHVLIKDAWCVFRKYPEWRDESKVWRERGSGEDLKAGLLFGSSPA